MKHSPFNLFNLKAIAELKPDSIDWTCLGATTLGISELSIMTLSIMTLSITTFSTMGLFLTLSITTLSTMGLFSTLNITILSINNTKLKCIERHYAECRVYLLLC